MERWRITVGELGQQFDLDFSDGKIVDRVCAGVHHLCNGFVGYRKVSPTHYALTCGGCGLNITLPTENQTKEQIVGFFFRKGLHRKGTELQICLDCEGRGLRRITEYKDGEEWINNRPITVTREITETIPCSNCQGAGILKKPAIT